MDSSDINDHRLFLGLEDNNEKSTRYAKEKAVPLKCFGRGISRPPFSSVKLKLPKSVTEELFFKNAVYDHMVTTSRHILDIGVQNLDEEDEIPAVKDFPTDIPFKDYTPFMAYSDDEIFHSESDEDDIENLLDCKALQRDDNLSNENNIDIDNDVLQNTISEDDNISNKSINTDSTNNILQSVVSNSQNICNSDKENEDLPSLFNSISQNVNNSCNISSEVVNLIKENNISKAHSKTFNCSNGKEGQMPNNTYKDTKIEAYVDSNSESGKNFSNNVNCGLTVSTKCNKSRSNGDGSSYIEESSYSSGRISSNSAESLNKSVYGEGPLSVDSIHQHENFEYSKYCNETYLEDCYDPKDPVRNRKWLVDRDTKAPSYLPNTNKSGFCRLNNEEEFPDLVPKKDCSVRPKVKTDHGARAKLNIKSIANSLFTSSFKNANVQNSDEDDNLNTSKHSNTIEGNCIVIENIPKQIDREELKSFLQGFGEVQKLLLKSKENKITAQVIIDGELDWIIECLDGNHAFGASSEALVCKRYS